MAAFIKRPEGCVRVSSPRGKLWRVSKLSPDRSGTFKLSKDPAFADIVGIYLEPPGGAVVLSIDDKTQIQALDWTQPLLPIEFAGTDKCTHDYVRHGTTDLFATMNVGTGQVFGECAQNP